MYRIVSSLVGKHREITYHITNMSKSVYFFICTTSKSQTYVNSPPDVIKVSEAAWGGIHKYASFMTGFGTDNVIPVQTNLASVFIIF